MQRRVRVGMAVRAGLSAICSVRPPPESLGMSPVDRRPLDGPGPKVSFSGAGAPRRSYMVVFTPEVFNPCASNIPADGNQEVGVYFYFR